MSHGAVSRNTSFGPSILNREKSAVTPSAAALHAPAMSTLTLAAFTLRLVLLDRFPFREDEAAYAYWALHGWLQDPMYLTVWPDKPPLFLWMVGAAFHLFGVSEASARWVNIAASVLTIPVTAAIARRLWGRRAALATATTLVLSPYAVSFAPTAYTDPLLVLAGMTALCAAVYGRTLWAGVFLGVAIMTKQQGLLYAPLVLGALWLATGAGRTSSREFVQSVCVFLVGLALVALPIIYWDSLRWTVAPSPWDLSVRNYAELAMLPPAGWPARAVEWSPLLWNMAASWVVWAALAGLLLAAIFSAHNADDRTERNDWRRYAAITLFGLWSLAFVAAHIVTTVQPWDRYLLPLAPMLALALGWVVHELGRGLSTGQMAAAGAAWLLLLTSPALDAAQGRLPIGADHGDYAGLTDAIESVRKASEEPFVLYHRALGSHYRFYLYEETAGSQAGATDLRWFANPVYLADNAAKTPYPRKFLIEPEWGPVSNLEAHLAMRGLVLAERDRFDEFRVWEIVPLSQPPCDWCMSRPRSPWSTVRGAGNRAYDFATPVQP